MKSFLMLSLPGRELFLWSRTAMVMMLRLLPPQQRPPLQVALLSLPMMMMVLLNLCLPHLLLLLDADTDAVETAAETLHQNLKTLEENEEDQRVVAELRRLFFQKRVHAVDGRKVQHVASAEETRLAITKLLHRRHDFLLQRNIAADKYVMTDEQRQDIFRI